MDASKLGDGIGGDGGSVSVQSLNENPLSQVLFAMKGVGDCLSPGSYGRCDCLCTDLLL